MPETLEQPPTTIKMPSKTGLSGWMDSLQSASPAPTLSGPAPEPAPEAPATPSPKTPAADPRATAAPPAVSTAPASPPPDHPEPPELPEDKWPRTAQEWKKFKEARKESESKFKKELAEYQAKVAEYEAKLKGGPTPEQLAEAESLKKENEELSKRLQTVDVTQHPKFQQYFETKTKAQLDLAKRIVGDELAPKVESLLKQPDSEWRNQQLEDVFTMLTPTQQTRIGGVLNSMEAINQERATEIAAAGENFQKIQAKQASEVKSRQDAFNAMFDQTAKTMTTSTPVFQKRESDDAWNSAVDARIATAKALLTGSGVKPEQIIRAAFDAVSLSPVLEDNLALRKQVETLQAQVKTLSSATPGIEAGRSSNSDTGGAPVPIKQGSRPMEATQAWAKAMTQAMQPRE